MSNFRRTCIQYALMHRRNAKRLERLAEMCRGAGLHDEVLSYTVEAQRSRDLAKQWELAGFESATAPESDRP